MAANTLSQGRRISLPRINWKWVGRWATLVATVIFVMWLGDRIGDGPRNYVDVTIKGLLVGAVYAIIAVGIVIINKASGVFNFAHGAMMLFTAWFFLNFYNAESFNMVAIVGLVGVTVFMFINMNTAFSFDKLFLPTAWGFALFALYPILTDLIGNGIIGGILRAIIPSLSTTVTGIITSIIGGIIMALILFLMLMSVTRFYLHVNTQKLLILAGVIGLVMAIINIITIIAGASDGIAWINRIAIGAILALGLTRLNPLTQSKDENAIALPYAVLVFLGVIVIDLIAIDLYTRNVSVARLGLTLTILVEAIRGAMLGFVLGLAHMLTYQNWKNVLGRFGIGKADDESIIPYNLTSILIAIIAGVVVVFVMTIGGDEWRLIRALVGAVVVATLMGLCIERFSIRPLMGQPIFTMVLMTLALDRIFVGMTNFFFPTIDTKIPIFNDLSGLGMPRNYELELVNIIPQIDRALRIPSTSIVIFILASLTFLAFILFFQYTSVGLSMRATAENQVLAQSVGLRVRAILAVAWVVTALLALIAGVLYGGGNSIGPTLPGIALIVFPAVLLGGLESVGGAFVGGLIIGLGQLWGDQLFRSEAGTQLVPYVILMVVLIFKPDGLFGQKRIERI